jgi:hypothetical protein
MGVTAHSRYSPDLAASDCYLFGHVKGLVRGESLETAAITIGGREHFGAFEEWTLTRVFLEWMTR